MNIVYFFQHKRKNISQKPNIPYCSILGRCIKLEKEIYYLNITFIGYCSSYFHLLDERWDERSNPLICKNKINLRIGEVVIGSNTNYVYNTKPVTFPKHQLNC